jgi:hypothetical protein
VGVSWDSEPSQNRADGPPPSRDGWDASIGTDLQRVKKPCLCCKTLSVRFLGGAGDSAPLRQYRGPGHTLWPKPATRAACFHVALSIRSLEWVPYFPVRAPPRIMLISIRHVSWAHHQRSAGQHEVFR